MSAKGHVIALCGGVGGAKLAFGLTRLLEPDALSLIVNTGDDFEHLGLTICPDIDTVAYTLAGLSDRERGWGLAGESWNFMEQLRQMGGEDWFNLGDKDLAMHVERTRMLRAGHSLSETTATLTAALGLRHSIIPMSDEPVRTIVETIEGSLPFQHYFVREQCRPVATGIHFEGAGTAVPSPGFINALQRSDVSAVIICPSNPYLSVDPILAIPDVREALATLNIPVIAVSPIVGGRALKGPAAKLMRELGVTPDVAAIADHYSGLINGLVIDETDTEQADKVRAAGAEPLIARSIMASDEDRISLARHTLTFARAISNERLCRA
jgi:LPPG:FO 2-phospho-L-lactate transferase